MSILDLAQRDQTIALGQQPGEAARLPVTFGEGLQAAWHEALLFGQSSAAGMATHNALLDYGDEVKRKTGRDITPELAEIVVNSDWTKAAKTIADLNAAFPDARLDPPTPDEINRRAQALSRQARTEYTDVAAREKASGGGFGTLLGGLAGGVTDPLNLATTPLFGGEAGILLTGLKFGAAATATQAANEAIGVGYREQVQPGYLTSGEPMANIAEAGVTGAALGAGGKTLGLALGRLWGRYKTGAWPTTVRDAGNLLESEANIQATNPFQGAVGEVAHRTALQDSIDAIVEGRPVNVDGIITGSVLEGYERRLAPSLDALSAVHDARTMEAMERTQRQAQAQPELPFEQSARQQAVGAAVDRLSGELEKLSREAGTVIAPEEARQLAERIATMPQDDAVRALDEFMLRPTTLRETLPPPDMARRAAPLAAEPLTPRAPNEAAQMLASPDHEAAVRADIDRARATSDVKIPAGIDEKGEPVFRSLDSALEEVDALKKAADEIQACANPVQEPTNG